MGRSLTRGIDPYAGVDVKGKIVLAHGPRALPKGVEIQQLGRLSIGASNVGGGSGAPWCRRGHLHPAVGMRSRAGSAWASQNLVRRELEPVRAIRLRSAAMRNVCPPASLRTPPRRCSPARQSPSQELIARGGRRPSDRPSLRAEEQAHAPRAGTDPPCTGPTTWSPSCLEAIRCCATSTSPLKRISTAPSGRRTVDGDSIYNSADDNATGSAGMLSIAERRDGRPADRSGPSSSSGIAERSRGFWGTRFFVQPPAGATRAGSWPT